MSFERYMTNAEVEAFKPASLPAPGNSPLDKARRAVERAGHFSANQQMGTRWPIGCVAL